ncbi:DUF3046 domain-containing protein [Trueperella sp. LYQ143]|uniref:DUF3046 domain-containing protein n=1 Tax=unclassified Trueperella TaxID=2630174 RepID=UPI0039833585
MKHSEFWDVVDRAFEHGLGRSLAHDLILAELDSRTAEEALTAGVEPQLVWHYLRTAMELPDSYEFLHRSYPKR